MRASAVAGRKRLCFIDAARGSAMFFVLLSHFGFTYFQDQQDFVPTMMRLVGMVASPTFVTISGMLVGFLYRTRRQDFDRLRVKFIDRGLFLLTVGHLLILGSHASGSYTIRFLTITDAIGVWMIVGPWLVARSVARGRILMGLGAYALSWVVIAGWDPQPTFLRLFKETFFGTLSTSTVYYYAFPIVPWCSFGLAGSALGDWLGVHHLNGDEDAMGRLLTRVAAGSLLAAVTLKAGLFATKFALRGTPLMAARDALASQFHKTPPSPVYFLFYGAIGLGLVAACLVLEQSGRAPRAVRHAAALGQASLATFVLQFYVYFPLLNLVRDHLPYASAWAVYFVASVVLVVLLALSWHRLGWNRLITVGFPSLWTRRLESGHESSALPAAPLRLSH